MLTGVLLSLLFFTSQGANYTWVPSSSPVFNAQFSALGAGPQSVLHTISVVGGCPSGRSSYTWATVHAAETDFPLTDTTKAIQTEISGNRTITCSGLGEGNSKIFDICFENEDINSLMPYSYSSETQYIDFTMSITSNVGSGSSNANQYFLNATLRLECSSYYREYGVSRASTPINLGPAAAVAGLSLFCCCGLICLVIIAKIAFWYFVCTYCCQPRVTVVNQSAPAPVQQVQQPLVGQQQMVQPVPMQQVQMPGYAVAPNANQNVYVPVPQSAPTYIQPTIQPAAQPPPAGVVPSTQVAPPVYTGPAHAVTHGEN